MANSNTDIAQTLVSAISSNPDLLNTFLNHPYTAVQEATGADEKLDKKDMSEVVTAAAGIASGQSFDASNLGSLASVLLGQNGNSVHTLVGSLFGGQAETQEDAKASASDEKSAGQSSGGIDLGSLVTLAGAAATLTGGKSTGVDLSDGIGLDDLAGLAGLMGGNTATASSSKGGKSSKSSKSQDSSNGILQLILNLIAGLFGGNSDED